MTEPDHRADAITPAEALELESQRLGALPIVDRFLGRMNVAALLDRHLPAGDARVTLPAANVIGVLVRNLCLEREPLYGLAEWADGFESRLVGLAPGEAVLLNDDRVGRALEQLFDADRGSLLTELALHVISAFGVDCSQLHNDSTSIALHGDYAAADGRARGGKPTPAAMLGHSKDHRPDPKQLVLILTVSRDGALPLAHRVADGNTTDDRTHIATWTPMARSPRSFVASSPTGQGMTWSCPWRNNSHWVVEFCEGTVVVLLRRLERRIGWAVRPPRTSLRR